LINKGGYFIKKDIKLYKRLKQEEKKNFSGWDFRYISKTGRCQEEPLSYSYGSKVLSYIENSERLLDMGTGGGEFLNLLKELPEETYATEGYKPNLKIAEKNLSKSNVDVVFLQDDKNLPFENKFFDLIINRHESFFSFEIFRILKNKGYFITQQVGGNNCIDLNEKLKAPVNEEIVNRWDLEITLNKLKNFDFRIVEKYEEYPKIRFYDVSAVVFFLSAISWQVPNFSVDKYFERLKVIDNEIKENGYIEFRQHRFFVIARKLS